MRPLQIRTAIRREPFEPFVVRTTGGQEYHVPHPEYAALAPSERVLVIFGPDGELVNVLDLLMIESIHYVDTGDGEAGLTDTESR